MTEAISGQRAQTLPGQSLVNRIMRGLLSTPLLSRLVGRRLVTLDVVGRNRGGTTTSRWPTPGTRGTASAPLRLDP